MTTEVGDDWWALGAFIPRSVVRQVHNIDVPLAASSGTGEEDRRYGRGHLARRQGHAINGPSSAFGILPADADKDDDRD
ncbi:MULTISPECIES: hypothetical protein [unclassified Mycobacterium]|uniref:hypothetical protein n=1 Tax=unclassified Mycobacterium TaxID=2642494 RepID=UPI0012EAD30A|nr:MULTISPECIES: hypothetical protein [unclassified Mycobacterium]